MNSFHVAATCAVCGAEEGSLCSSAPLVHTPRLNQPLEPLKQRLRMIDPTTASIAAQNDARDQRIFQECFDPLKIYARAIHEVHAYLLKSGYVEAAAEIERVWLTKNVSKHSRQPPVNEGARDAAL